MDLNDLDEEDPPANVVITDEEALVRYLVVRYMQHAAQVSAVAMIGAWWWRIRHFRRGRVAEVESRYDSNGWPLFDLNEPDFQVTELRAARWCTPWGVGWGAGGPYRLTEPPPCATPPPPRAPWWRTPRASLLHPNQFLEAYASTCYSGESADGQHDWHVAPCSPACFRCFNLGCGAELCFCE